MIMNHKSKRVVVQNYNIDNILHEDDKSIINKLNAIPGFKTFLNNTVGAVRDAYCNVEAAGDGWLITQQSSPELYGRLKEACRVLNVRDIPRFSSEWFYMPSSVSSGKENFRIILTSGAIDLLDETEQLFFLGHELGHNLCGHKPYQMLIESFYLPMADIASVKVWSTIIKVRLLDWYRKCDLSADRMGLLCCQDINAALRTMIKRAGLPKKYYELINIPAFLKQAEEFETKYSGKVDTLAKTLALNSSGFPWMVHRAAELVKWYESGEYQRIITQK